MALSGADKILSGHHPDIGLSNPTESLCGSPGPLIDAPAAMSLPRQVLPGHFYLITRRCTQRQFLLRPDRETNNAFTYCLAEAAQRCAISVLLPCAMSNHYHAVIYDELGTYPQFIEHFNKMFARSQNALRGRWENFWSSEQICVVKLVDREAVLDKLVYTATNPVKDHLVDRVHHWPGVNGLHALLKGRPLRAVRPRHFFRANGPMPAEVQLTLAIPPQLGSASELLAELEQRVRAAEAQAAAERQRTGRRVCGRRAVLQQSWRGHPSTREPRRNLRPRTAAGNKWARLEALLRDREFIIAYTQARKTWRKDATVKFPPGTYWLRRFMSVPIAET